MNKKNVIFFFSGQSRTNRLSHNAPANNNVLNSYNKYIFTDEFKEKYNYKIFISTDDIHLENTIKYFGKNNVSNIHLLNTNFYLKKIQNKILGINEYLTNYHKYHETQQTGKYALYDNSIYQHYKILDCFNLYRNECVNNNCDYMIRTRLDIEFTSNITQYLDRLENSPELDVLMHWDLFAIGRPNIMMCYFTGLEHNYGKYNFNAKLINAPLICHEYFTLEKFRWTYAPEIQLFEMLFEYCNVNNDDINIKINSIVCCEICR